jgi:phosphoserine phosphatase
MAKAWRGSHGYSDSINDVPLLQAVEVAYTVNADPKLAPWRHSRAGIN